MAIEHQNSKSPDPNTALAEVLTKAQGLKKRIPVLKLEMNTSKIFDDDGKVKNMIELTGFDTQVAIKLVKKVQNLLPRMTKEPDVGKCHLTSSSDHWGLQLSSNY